MPSQNNKRPLRLVLTGGGTMGSVTPLLAVVEAAARHGLRWNFSFVGTRSGPEGKIVSQTYGLGYWALPEAKLRRYFSWRNGVLPAVLAAALGQSIRVLRRAKPDVVVAAGSFVAVPVVWAAHLLKIPSVIYQMDVTPGLANRLLAKVATRIAVAFRHHVHAFTRAKTVPVGMIVRPSILHGHRIAAIKDFGLERGLPTVLIVGGGTGAKNLNQKVVGALPRLTEQAQVIHITGAHKATSVVAKRYHQFEFLGDGMPNAFAVADVVVARGGLSTMSELAALGKVSVIVPMPDSHQEQNADFLRRHNAAAVLSQKGLAVETFAKTIEHLLQHQDIRKIFSQNIRKLYEPDGLDHFLAVIAEAAHD